MHPRYTMNVSVCERATLIGHHAYPRTVNDFCFFQSGTKTLARCLVSRDENGLTGTESIKMINKIWAESFYTIRRRMEQKIYSNKLRFLTFCIGKAKHHARIRLSALELISSCDGSSYSFIFSPTSRTSNPTKMLFLLIHYFNLV